MYGQVPGQGAPIYVSCPTQPSTLPTSAVAKSNIYLMLHGDYRNAAAFWGEDDNGLLVAIDTSKVPATGADITFAGCCWGALTVAEPAFLGGGQPTPRMVERSMALQFLKGGARAFVGSTGVHYSPTDAGNFFGGPLHTHFWTQLATVTSPAEALFQARKTYLDGMPHGRNSLFDIAVERKIYKQFTCLGLGW